MGFQSAASAFVLLTGLGHRLKLGRWLSVLLARSAGQQTDVHPV